MVHFGAYLFQLLHYFLISSGMLKKYRVLPLHKLQYLAIVLDSGEAADTFSIRNLLRWLSSIGVKNVILYDMEGVLKRSESSLRRWLDLTLTFYDSSPLSNQDKMSLEFLSYSDGKEAIAKAASFLCSKYLEDNNLMGETREPVLSESDIAEALRIVGCSGPEPELLLVFSPIRCHLGFPAWRMRYTEIVHMGPLKSMNYGAVIKAIYDLSKKQQNHGMLLNLPPGVSIIILPT
ncbi:unnamed protein product [Spirodela intermedia]|uniref:ditrans,polycis-polyprenyl diphosphate synthase [(2E,6E)-farnesyldiphosphate specific] n=1 Tax=Spirodela intermedia TaxID=51605 RepID=A0A7I8II67_SPIIN|nr:unnamed protein product [Spirodela intermedia]CAA6657573.1 unnamed protein product [Spirodela intermedia]